MAIVEEARMRGNVKDYVPWVLFVVLGFFACGCQTTGTGRSVTKKTDIRLKGLRRNYLLYVPKCCTTENPAPLVLVIHGAFSTARDMEKVSDFSRLAEEEGFLVAYPNGFGIFGLLQHWNAGHCCGKAKKDNIDDIAFLEAVIDDVKSHVSVDARRVYVVGFSNGGMLAYRFAAERSQTVAAVAALAAALGGDDQHDEHPWEMPDPTSPVPVLIMHGDADDSVPYLGGRSSRHPNQYYLSVKEAVDFWVQHNHVHSTAQRTTLNQGQVQVDRWDSTEGQAETVLYTLKGWGHQWPGRHVTDRLPVSDPLHGFDGTRIIWEFLQDKQRQDGSRPDR